MIKAYARPGEDSYLTINANFLDIKRSLAYRNHSPSGFSWGYGGSGPAQLALAILLEFTRPEEAQTLYQQFKFDVIAKMPQGKDWQMPNQRVIDWLAAIRSKGATP